MAGEVEFTDAFHRWWNSLSEGEQDDVALSVRHLMEFGPALGFDDHLNELQKEGTI